VTTVSIPPPEMTVGRQGHYAGAVSRLVAFGADVGIAWLLYSVALALIDGAVKLFTGHSYTLSNHQTLAVVTLTVWEFVYFTYQWSVSGKTLGMAIFGIQVVTAQGGPIGIRQAAVRTVGLGLTLPIFLIAFPGIVFQRERRAFLDFMAGTCVVYDWDARAARLRWLAHKDRTAQGRKRGQSHTVPAPHEDHAP
jgi:uncharacterized RDD family membrane protein YckC